MDGSFPKIEAAKAPAGPRKLERLIAYKMMEYT